MRVEGAGTPSVLTLGWQVTPSGEPRYWLDDGAKAGGQSEGDLVRVPAPAMATHAVVVAQSGSGKSSFLGRLVEELLLRTKARCVIFDPNSDFRRVHEVEDARLWRDANYDAAAGRGRLPTESSRAEFVGEWQAIAIRILGGPGLLHGAGPPYQGFALWWPSLSMDFLGEDLSPLERGELYHCHAFLQAIADLVSVKPTGPEGAGDVIETAEALYRETREDPKNRPATKDRIESAIRRKFDIDALADVKRNPVLKAGIASASLFWPPWRPASPWASAESPDALQQALRARLETDVERAATALSYVSDDIARFYFGKAREFRTARILASKPPSPAGDPERLTVVDLPSLRDASTRLLAIHAILAAEWDRARLAWADALQGPPDRDDRVPTFIVLEEAHNLIPAEPTGRAQAAMREQFRTIVAEGRKYGLFLVLVSQRPDKLDPIVLSECENKAIMRLDSEAALDASRRLLGLGEVPSETLAKVRGFGIGRALLVGRWARGGPLLLFTAARRTIEGGRNLRAEHWAHPSSSEGAPA